MASKRSAAAKRKASRARAAAYRARMRAQGLRLIQMWVPDTRSPEFAKEARRQMRALARSPQEKEDQAFVDAISEFTTELSASPKRRRKRRVGKGA